jgi:hypothetical protein
MGARAADGVVERLKQRLSEGFRVEALILFGSRASGTARDDSDYDVIIVSPDFEGVPFLERSRLLLPFREPRLSYDFLCYTPAEFERLSSERTVVREAVRTGIRVI